jgi:hypothetical protein
VLISREIFYRICELTINLNLNKKEAMDLFREAMEISVSLSADNKPGPASAQTPRPDDVQAKETADTSPEGVD